VVVEQVVIENQNCATTSGCYSASPLATATSLPVSVQHYPITVGGGGAAGYPESSCTAVGSNSVFSTITSTGGGAGRELTMWSSSIWWFRWWRWRNHAYSWLWWDQETHLQQVLHKEIMVGRSYRK
jgi:hypothetical protein